MKSLIQSSAVTLIGFLWLGCGGSGEASPATGATSDGGAGGSGGAGSTGGGGGSVDWSACGAHAPNSTCTKDTTCHYANCGKATSNLDQNGCVRASCTSDADCGAGEECFPSWVVYTILDTSYLQLCGNDTGSCKCLGTSWRVQKPYCLAKSEADAISTCSLDPAIAYKCQDLSLWIDTATMQLSQLSLSSTMAALAQRGIDSARQQKMKLADAGCQ